MTAALLDDLLAGYVAPAGVALAAPTPAKPAKAANLEHPCGLAPASAVCEGLRIPANAGGVDAADDPDSQTFAGVRKPQTGPQSKQTCGSSQDSQNSQGYPVHCTTEGWSEADIARFLDRQARLLRWGWPERDAETVAERLVRRDIEGDDRVSCTDCRHYRPGRCGCHARAGLQRPDVGRDLATLLQRCPGFEPSR